MGEFVRNIRVCSICGVPISAERLAAIPTTNRCTKHSVEKAKTAADVDVASADPEDVKKSGKDSF